MGRNALKGYRFTPETVQFVKELQELVSEALGGVHVTQVQVVQMAIRNEYYRRTEEVTDADSS